MNGLTPGLIPGIGCMSWVVITRARVRNGKPWVYMGDKFREVLGAWRVYEDGADARWVRDGACSGYLEGKGPFGGQWLVLGR